MRGPLNRGPLKIPTKEAGAPEEGADPSASSAHREGGGAPGIRLLGTTLLVWIVKPSGCRCTDASGGENCRRAPTPLRSTSPLSDRPPPISIYYTILYYTILYYTILYYTILYNTIPYHTIPYYTIPYCTMLHYSLLRQEASKAAFSDMLVYV